MLSGTTKPHLGTSGFQVVFLCSFELRTGTHVHLRTVTSRTESRTDPPLGYQMGLRVQLTNLSTLSTFLPSGSVLSLPWLQTPRSKRFLSHGEISVPNAGEGKAFQGLPKHWGKWLRFLQWWPLLPSLCQLLRGWILLFLGNWRSRVGIPFPVQHPSCRWLANDFSPTSLQKWAEAQTEKNNYHAQPCTPVRTKAKETKHTLRIALGAAVLAKWGFWLLKHLVFPRLIFYKLYTRSSHKEGEVWPQIKILFFFVPSLFWWNSILLAAIIFKQSMMAHLCNLSVWERRQGEHYKSGVTASSRIPMVT